jgi:predicted transcriptional regulator
MRTACLSVALLLLVPCVQVLAAVPEIGARAPDFDLKDQFGKQWKLDDLAGQVTVVVVADTESGRAMGPWVDALKARYPNKVRILGLLDLHSVPGIGRGIAKSRIKRETKDPMMLDFDGSIARAYGVSSKVPGVIVIDRTSIVRAAVSAAYDQKGLATATSAVDKALAAK